VFVWREVGGARGTRAAGLAGLQESGFSWRTCVGAATERRRIVLRASFGVAKDAREVGVESDARMEGAWKSRSARWHGKSAYVASASHPKIWAKTRSTSRRR